MTPLLLVRHGQSVWNAEGRWQGQADPPLSELGERQAVAAARALTGIDVVVTSDLERARRTAEIIADVVDVDVVLDADFRERDAGEWAGLTRDEIEARFPGYLAERLRPPGFESDEDLLERALQAVARVSMSHPGRRVLVVTHGGVMYTIERHLQGERAPLANLAGRWLHADGDGLSLGDRVLLVDPHEVTLTVPGQI